MKLITLTKGKFAQVDDEWYDYLNQWGWFYQNGYAIRRELIDGKKKTIHMHRVVNDTPAGILTDHVDLNKLNNQASNLRNASNIQNSQNVSGISYNAQGIKGVDFHKGKYRAKIQVNGKSIHIGYYNTPKEAGEKYREASIKYFGEFSPY